MDLSKIPTEDLKAISQGKWKDVSTPGLQSYQSAMQAENQAQTQSLNPQKIPDAADKAAQNGSDKAQSFSNQPDSPLMQYIKKGVSVVNSFRGGLVKGGTGGLLNPSAIPGVGEAMKDSPIAAGAGQIGGSIAMGGMIGAGAAAIAPTGSGMLPAAGRIAANAGAGAVQGAMQPGEDRSGNAELGAVLGGGASAIGEAAAPLSSKLADYLMQKSVGLRKLTPGVGNRLADMGVVGTKNMMAGQVENKLASQEEKLQGLVKDLQGSVNSSEIADAVSQKAQQFTLPSSGKPSPFSQAELQKVRGLSEEISKMGDLNGEDLLALKRQGDYQGYTASGTPATSTESMLGRTGADAARQAIRKMSPEAADTLLNEQALVKANQSLNKPESIHQGMGSSMFFGKAPGQDLLSSILGQGANQSSQLAKDPAAIQGTLGGLFGSSQK